MDVAAAQVARALHRSKVSHQEDKLSHFTQGEPHLHPGGLFSDIVVMAAMAVMAIMAA